MPNLFRRLKFWRDRHRAPLWDVFVSHASEDKQSLAAPIATFLRRAGFSVWLDQFTLKAGDNFLQRIDHGLRESACGLLIISPRYVEKTFTNYEIERLLATERRRGIKIIPLRFGIPVEDIVLRYPALTSRLILDLGEGVEFVAAGVANDLLSDPELPAARRKSLPRRFTELLADTSNTADIALPGRFGLSSLHRTASAVRIAQFLHNYPEILGTAYGTAGNRTFVHSNIYPDLGSLRWAGSERMWDRLDDPEYRALARQSSLCSDFDVFETGGTSISRRRLLILGADQSLLEGEERDKEVLIALKAALSSPARMTSCGRSSFEDDYTIVSGRRAGQGSRELTAIQAFNSERRPYNLMLRSHDWLLDACTDLWKANYLH